MTNAPPPPTGRPRRPLAAFLLNVILPPAGYVYVGSWLTAAIAFLLVILVPMAALEVTNVYPPGLYALGLPGIVVGSLSALLLMGSHAAVLASKAPPKTGSRILHLGMYLGAWAVAFACNLILRAYWPTPTYEIQSASMSPNLQAGDILLADGPRALCGKGGLKPGQVVVYRRRGSPERYIERVVAGPGQTVSMDAGRLRVDGRVAQQRVSGAHRVAGTPIPATVVRETLPDGASYDTLDFGPDGALDTVAPLIVPAGSWYLLGDNRDDAADSRAHGPVKASDICAIATKLVAANRNASRVGRSL